MKFKYYFSSKNKKPFDKCVDDYKKMKYYNAKKYNANFVYLLDEKDLFNENIEKEVKTIITKLWFSGIRKDEYTISFNHQTMSGNLNGKALASLCNLEKRFKRVNFGIENVDKTWKTDEIAQSNAKLDEIANKIKQKDMSPVEMLLSAYLEVTKRPYNGEKNEVSIFRSRTIYGVLNSDKIVCVGYTELFKEIVSRLDLPNVKMFLNMVNVTWSKYSDGHQNMIIYLKDDKYGLDGYYYFDPTFDSVKDGDKQPRLSFFMLPISEIKNTMGYKLKELENDFDGKPEPKVFFDGKTLMFNVPIAVDKISVYDNGAMINKSFLQFLKQDKKLEPLFENMKRQYPDEEKMFRNYDCFAHRMLEDRSEDIDGETIEAIVKNTIQKLNPDLSTTQANEKADEICDENCKYAQDIFKFYSNSAFMSLRHIKAVRKQQLKTDENVQTKDNVLKQSTESEATLSL